MDQQSVSEKGTETLKNLEKLLEKFSHNGAKPEVYYHRLYQKLESFFRLKGLSRTDAAVDVTIDRLSKLFGEQHESVEDIYRLAYKIAGFVYLEFLRADKKERDAVETFQQIQNANNSEFEQEEIDLIDLQRKCLNRLSDDEQQLLRDYYEEGTGQSKEERRTKLAKELNVTKSTLRVKVMRLRQKVEEMLETENNQ
jgi:DNA-directed RNA polymerase specialized sigma24 family protein